MSSFDNLVNFYNVLMKNIYDDSSEFYKNLNEQQKKLCTISAKSLVHPKLDSENASVSPKLTLSNDGIDKKLRIIVIIQNNISKKYFKQLYQKYFPDIKIKTDDIMILIKEFTKINSNENFINFIKNFKNIKNNFVKKFIQNQIAKDNYITDFNAIIIGCLDSTDIDILINIDESYDINNIKITDSDIISQLEYKCIYKIDKTKKIDINIIHIKNKKVIKSQKGSIKTLQGIIYYTQHFHMKKEYIIDIDKPDKF
jgi:hypothetical protein